MHLRLLWPFPICPHLGCPASLSSGLGPYYALASSEIRDMVKEKEVTYTKVQLFVMTFQVQHFRFRFISSTYPYLLHLGHCYPIIQAKLRTPVNAQERSKDLAHAH